MATSSQSASELLPRVHRVAALLKRWLMGTHQGAVSREHLDYYLDEYTFRFNRRRSRHRESSSTGLCNKPRPLAHHLFRDGTTRARSADQPTTRYGVAGSDVHTTIFPITRFKATSAHIAQLAGMTDRTIHQVARVCSCFPTSAYRFGECPGGSMSFQKFTHRFSSVLYWIGKTWIWPLESRVAYACCHFDPMV